ncbi:sensor histidine kinase [Umezawaea endophytica]|uniref:histidine kinase n=1 Tax=Umezawaea endophytica TaxID=1654476 RepID=A0A9X2VM76_9PSEU|nr:histidine kinase [Umezawaea endophytica]MCS7477758.1 histidine kinase [Umezawaea endophytica]
MDGFRRQWPTVLALGALLVTELVWLVPVRGPAIWSWLLSLPVCVAAVTAHRFPAASTAVAATSVVLASFADQAGSHQSEAAFGLLSLSETAACMALVAAVVRYAALRTAVTSVGVLMAVSLHAAVARDLSWTESNIVGSLLLGVVAVGTGRYFRARDAERERVLSASVSGAQREERIALARELHDVVAHYVTGMLVQAQAALDVADEDPKAAHRLLPGIIDSGTTAVGAMRRLVGTLREGGPEVATTDLGADVLAVVERSRDQGLPVRLRIDLPPELPPELGRSVLRLVQESLTNAHKHAVEATEVAVELSRTPTALRVVVTDDGRQASTRASGYGLVGMRERVDILGGRFSAGPGETGWRVLAELPWEGRG